MIHLADEFFASKNDPSQIVVTEQVLEHLRNIHPATLSEYDHGNGPVAWILIIPTLKDLMEQFIARQMNEQELLDRTPVPGKYDAIYLCSALVLPEYRAKGIAKHLLLNAVRSIMADHPVKHLFYWAFSPKGKKLAVSVAREIGLELLQRPG